MAKVFVETESIFRQVADIPACPVLHTRLSKAGRRQGFNDRMRLVLIEIHWNF